MKSMFFAGLVLASTSCSSPFSRATNPEGSIVFQLVNDSLDPNRPVYTSGWLLVSAKDSTNPIGVRNAEDSLGLCQCGTCEGSCSKYYPAVQPMRSREIKHGESQQLTWDGSDIRYGGTCPVDDTTDSCYNRELVAQGEYVARFCYAFTRESCESSGDYCDITMPQCSDVPFTYPSAEPVVFVIR